MPTTLSPTMLDALIYANVFGCLQRYPRGFWRPGSPSAKHFGTTTIEALVARGKGTYTDWQDGKHGKFPVQFTPTPEPVREGRG